MHGNRSTMRKFCVIFFKIRPIFLNELSIFFVICHRLNGRKLYVPLVLFTQQLSIKYKFAL